MKNGYVKNEYVKSELIKLKTTLINSLLIVVAVLGLPSLIASIISLKSAGTFPVFSLIGYFVIIVLVIFSKKTSLHIKSGVFIGIGFILGTKALINQGIISDGLLYYLILGVISSILLGTVYGIIVTFISLFSACIIAFLYHNGTLGYTFNIRPYAESTSTWLSFILVTFLFSSIAIILSSRINSYLFGIFESMSARSNNLKEANQKLAEEIEQRITFEISLKNTAKTFKNIFNSINDAIVIFDEENNIVEANNAFYEFTGYEKDLKRPFNLGDLLEDYDKIKTSVFEGAKDIFSFYKNEVRLKTRRDQNSIPVEITLIPFPGEQSETKLIILRDITKSKESERQVLNAIIQAEEKERTRVSQDLHDSLGPLLSAIKLYSNSIVTANDAPKRNEIHSKITELMDEAIKTVKEISNNLSSHVLKSFGLFEAIDSFAEKIQATYPIKIITMFDQEIKTSEMLQISLYRVLVELINNTLKYAYASQIKIKIGMKDEKLMIVYQDNGKGFDVEQAILEGKGMGLYNMHSRIKSLGGTVMVKSKSDKGIRVEIQI